MLLYNILIFFFLFSSLYSTPLSLSLLSHFLALFFCQNFLSFFSIFSLKFFSFSSQIFSLFLLNFFLCCVRVSSFAVWVQVWWVMPWVCVWWVIDVMAMPWVWWVIGFELCHGCGFVPWCSGVLPWWVTISCFCGSCHGVYVLGHQRHGYAVGVLGHRFQVMPWVWVAVGFIFVVVG